MPDSFRRILAIFRKDARHLWPSALIFAALLVCGAFSDPAYTSQGSTAYHFYLQNFGLPLACLTLIALAIHEDRLVGDRQYWLARPYAPRELFAAKALFVLVFINLTVLVQQTVILMATGISPAAHWKALVWNQITLAIFVILPGAALAAVTRNLAQMVLAALLVSLALLWFLFQGLFRYAGTPLLFLTLPGALAIVAGVAAVLLLQYARRQTSHARAAVATTVILILAAGSREQMIAFERWKNPIQWRDEVRIRFDPSPARRLPLPASGRDVGPVRVEIPIHIEGIPAGLDIATDDVAVGLRGPGIPLGSGANRLSGIRMSSDGQAWKTVYIKREDFDSIGEIPVDLYGSMELTLFHDRLILPLPAGTSVAVPGIGLCRDRPYQASFRMIECLTPKPRVSVRFVSSEGDATWIVPPGLLTGQGPRPYVTFHHAFTSGGMMWGNHRTLPSSTGPLADFRGFTVLDRFATRPAVTENEDDDGKLIIRTPASHFRVAFKFDGINLRDYVASR